MNPQLVLALLAVGVGSHVLAGQIVNPEPLGSARRIATGSKHSAQDYLSAEDPLSPKYTKQSSVKNLTKEKKKVSTVSDNDFSSLERIQNLEKDEILLETKKNDLIINEDQSGNYVYKKKHTVGFVFKHLFDIIRDVFSIMSRMKSSNSIDRVECGDAAVGNSCSWPLIRVVFLKYLQLVKETELLSELRDVIPINKLEHALQTGDAGSLMQVMVKTATPAMFSLVVKVLSELLTSFMYLTSNIHSAQLREYIPSHIDIMWPVKFVVGRALGILDHVFSKRRLANYWEEFRSFSPFAARSLEYILPTEIEDEVSANALYSDASEDRDSDGGIVQSVLSNPYLLVAGVGTTAIASVISYRMATPSAVTVPQNNRVKRNAPDLFSHFSNMTLADFYHIMTSVETKIFDSDYEADKSKASITKPKKTMPKKYLPIHKTLKKDYYA